MYTGAKTVIRIVYGNSKGFEAKSGYAPRFSIKSTVIRDCHGGHILKIQGCPAMGTAVC